LNKTNFELPAVFLPASAGVKRRQHRRSLAAVLFLLEPCDVA